MGTKQFRNVQATRIPTAGIIDMKLEVVVIPVADVDRARSFYASLGWRLDVDTVIGEDSRVVQFTPPGSHCSIIFGTGVTPSPPGSAQGLYLVVFDIVAARAALIARGVEVGEIFHRASTGARVPGRDPEHRSYQTYAPFIDPDGNGWLLQEIQTRLPGRA